MNIIAEIREEIQAARVEPSSRDLNILALLFLIIPGLIGSYLLFWKGSSNGYVWIAGGAGLCACRVVPPLFRLIYKLWVGFSVILGYFVSRILMTIIFFTVITPTGLIMRMMGKDPMRRRLDPQAKTYWMAKPRETEISIEKYEKQF